MDNKSFLKYILILCVSIYFIKIYNDDYDGDQSTIKSIINIIFNNNNNINNINSSGSSGIDNDDDYEIKELKELLKQTELFYNYPSKSDEIINKYEQKQEKKRKRIEELNQINQLNHDLQRDINYSIIFVTSFATIPIIISIIFKLYKTYLKNELLIATQLETVKDKINQIKIANSLIELNKIKSIYNSNNIILLKKSLLYLKRIKNNNNQDNSSSNSSSNSSDKNNNNNNNNNNNQDNNSMVLLEYEKEIKTIETKINERMNEEKEFWLSLSYGGNLLLSDSSGIIDIQDTDNLVDMGLNDNKLLTGSSGINNDIGSNSGSGGSISIGPINEESINDDNDTSETNPSSSLPSSSLSPSPSLTNLDSISKSNLKLNNNNNNNNNNSSSSNSSNDNRNNNYNYKNIKYDKQLRRVSLEFKKDIAVVDYERLRKLEDEAAKELNEIEKEIKKERSNQKEKQDEQERIKKEKQDQLDEITSTKFFSIMIKLMLVLNIIPELFKLLKHHTTSLLPTIACLNLNEYFTITKRELINNNNTNSIFNPKYYLKLFLNSNSITLNSPPLNKINNDDYYNSNSLNINIKNIFNCIPTSFEINWRLWFITLIYLALLVISLQCQINPLIVSLIFLTISISTYKINYHDINHYLLHILFNLLIIYSVKRYNHLIKQSKYQTIIRILITLILILYNCIILNWYLNSKILLKVK